MKIAIVGTKPETWQKCPVGEDWQLWRFGRKFWDRLPRPDKWFELHHPSVNKRKLAAVAPGYKEFLEDAVTYDCFPFDALREEFGPYFFTGGQVSWIMAFAITKAPQTIGLWGIDPSKPIHFAQLRGIHHFAQVARDRGIEVISPEDNILEPPLSYAVDVLHIEPLPGPRVKYVVWK